MHRSVTADVGNKNVSVYTVLTQEQKGKKRELMEP